MLQIVVIIVIWVISLLVIYMLFLICLDPLLNKRIHKASANIGYHEHNNEEVNIIINLIFFSLYRHYEGVAKEYTCLLLAYEISEEGENP